MVKTREQTVKFELDDSARDLYPNLSRCIKAEVRIKEVYESIRATPDEPPDIDVQDHNTFIEGIWFFYPNQDRWVLADESELTVYEREIVLDEANSRESDSEYEDVDDSYDDETTLPSWYEDDEDFDEDDEFEDFDDCEDDNINDDDELEAEMGEDEDEAL